VADSLYLLTVASSTYSNTSWFNPLWYASPVIMGWSAWLPTRGATQQTARTTNKRRIVMPLMFSAIALGTLVWGNLWAIGAPAVVLSALSLLVVMGRLALTWRENNALLRTTQVEAQTDALTGLANRRALSVALASRLDRSTPRRSLLALFDLDGFKQYNDTFGHPAGDTLLQRLAAKLQSQLPESATAFRIGGDEFCVLIDAPGDPLRAVAASVRALSEGGEGFAIGASHGSVLLPQEAHTPSEALQIADSRMYAQKHGRRLSASRQSRDVLLRALAERNPELGVHVHDVGDLARACASSFGLRPDQVEEIGHAAELHDVGKVAIPDAILNKPAALDDAEWAFIRRHTLIGQRITGAAPALERVALLVRSTHENVDGSGYPDGLAGDEIPLGSRIIAVCDAYDAMTTDRPYRRRIRREAAMAELRRCAGTQFDPQVVERFCAALQQRAAGSGPQLHVAA
jgi:diguanylate cyclase (GGDEF)-like protein